jgi:hypothetical protein
MANFLINSAERGARQMMSDRRKDDSIMLGFLGRITMPGESSKLRRRLPSSDCRKFPSFPSENLSQNVISLSNFMDSSTLSLMFDNLLLAQPLLNLQ